MVWGVCCRVLRDPHDADDAFQATFLVLVRKAATVRPRHAVGTWLYGVAYRTALKARSAAARRRVKERQAAACRSRAVPESTGPETGLLLDQAIHRLPEQYRAVVVLCDLEGATRKEAARRLGWPEGTVAGRLARARTLLARRLARCGLSAPLVALAAAGGNSTAGTPALPPLAAAAQAVTPRAAALAGAVVRAMGLAKLRAGAVGLAVMVGVVSLAYAGAGGAGADALKGTAEVPRKADRRPVPSAERLVGYLNDAAGRIRSLRSDGLYLDCKQGRESVGVIANFVCLKPGSFRLRGVLAGQQAFDIGCNDRECWYWLRGDDPPKLHHFRLRDLSAAGKIWPLPCRPEWFLEVLGMADLDPAEHREVIVRPKSLELVEKVQTPQGRPAFKVTVFDRTRPRAPVTERLLRDAAGNTLCRATLRDLFTDTATGAVVPREAELDWPALRVNVRLKLDQLKVNPELDKEFSDRIFRRPPIFPRSLTLR
jgi:RNA polymerase sigma factor (sigma-70 family)